jgi:hypothetical protein
MDVKLNRQSPEIRCYRCGSADIQVICHHCGRPMCANHGPVTPPLSWFTENREFNRLSLGSWPLGSDGAHCHEHVHYSLNYRRILVVPGMLIGAAGLLLLLVQLARLVGCLFNRPPFVPAGVPSLYEALRDPSAYAGLSTGLCYMPDLLAILLAMLQYALPFGFGLVVFFTGWAMNKKKIMEELSRKRVEVPFGLVSERIEVLEKLKASMLMDAHGKVTTQVLGEVSGEIRPNFRFTRLDKVRLEEYREKYGLSSEKDLPFQSGYLLLSGRPNLLLRKTMEEKIQHLRDSEPRFQPERPNLLWLEGQTGSVPFLGEGRGSNDPRWGRSWHYKVQHEARAWGEVPVRIVPVMLEAGNVRSLQLQLQFNPGYFPTLLERLEHEKSADILEREQVLLLEQAQVWVDPAHFGRPQSSGVISEVERRAGEGVRNYFQLDWRGLWFKIEKGSNNFRLPEIGFDQAIEPGSRLRGVVRLRVPALVSQLATIRYFSALGQPVNDRSNLAKGLPFDGSTLVELAFDLALTRLPHVQSQPVYGQKLIQPGAPSPARVRALVDALNHDPSSGQAAHMMYVRRVVESLPQVSEQQGESVRSHWDISGRTYRHTLPIDFHLVLYGHGDQHNGLTNLELSVQGQVFDPESREQLDAAHAELQDTIREAFTRSSAS